MWLSRFWPLFIILYLFMYFQIMFFFVCSSTKYVFEFVLVGHDHQSWIVIWILCLFANDKVSFSGSQVMVQVAPVAHGLVNFRMGIHFSLVFVFANIVFVSLGKTLIPKCGCHVGHWPEVGGTSLHFLKYIYLSNFLKLLWFLK